MTAERVNKFFLDSQKLRSDMDQLFHKCPALGIMSVSASDISVAKRLDKLDKLIRESERLLLEDERLDSESGELIDLSIFLAELPAHRFECHERALEAQRLGSDMDRLLHGFPAFEPVSASGSNLPAAERLDILRNNIDDFDSQINQPSHDFAVLKTNSTSSIPYNKETERIDRLVREARRIRSEINQVQHDFPALNIKLAHICDVPGNNETNLIRIVGPFLSYSGGYRADIIRAIRDALVLMQQSPIEQLKKTAEAMSEEIKSMQWAFRKLSIEADRAILTFLEDARRVIKEAGELHRSC